MPNTAFMAVDLPAPSNDDGDLAWFNADGASMQHICAAVSTGHVYQCAHASASAAFFGRFFNPVPK